MTTHQLADALNSTILFLDGYTFQDNDIEKHAEELLKKITEALSAHEAANVGDITAAQSKVETVTVHKLAGNLVDEGVPMKVAYACANRLLRKYPEMRIVKEGA